MNIKKCFLSFAMVLSLAAISAADEGSQIKGEPNNVLINDLAAKFEPVIRMRELKFDIAEEEESIPLQNVQEGMLDQRYVATLHLVIPKNEKYEPPMPGFGGSYQNTLGDEPENLLPHQQLLRDWIKHNSCKFGLVENRSIASLTQLGWAEPIPQADARRLRRFEQIQHNIQNIVMTVGRNGNIYSYSRQSGLISQLASLMPEQKRPAKEIYDVFTAKNPPFILMHRQDEKGFGNPSFIIDIGILAPTAEQAKQWSEGWLVFYDWGLCYPAQQECMQVIKNLKEDLAKQQQSVNKIEMDLNKYERLLDESKEFDDVNTEVLSALKAQRRLLSIDQKGVTARIEACDKMLADLKQNQEQNTIVNRQQPETAKVAAEIELVGLMAKHMEIDRIIQGVEKQREIVSKKTSAEQEISWKKQVVEQKNGIIELMKQYQLGYQPLPVENNKVTIRRIKWTTPPKTDNSPK